MESRAGAATVKARIKAGESADNTLNKRAASAREHHENRVSERVRTRQNGPLKTFANLVGAAGFEPATSH
jgi:hypothetical protein